MTAVLVHPPKQCTSTCPFTVVVTLSDGFASSCAGQCVSALSLRAAAAHAQ